MPTKPTPTLSASSTPHLAEIAAIDAALTQAVNTFNALESRMAGVWPSYTWSEVTPLAQTDATKQALADLQARVESVASRFGVLVNAIDNAPSSS